MKYKQKKTKRSNFASILHIKNHAKIFYFFGHQKFFCTGIEGLKLPIEDKKDPLNDFFAITALG